MNPFSRLRFQQKIAWSFGGLALLVFINALVGVLIALVLVGRIDRQDLIARVVEDNTRLRDAVGRFVKTGSREAVRSAFGELDGLRGRIEALRGGDARLDALPAQLDDYRLHFQKFVAETDQTAALESRAAMLGRRMLEELGAAGARRVDWSSRAGFDVVVARILDLQWLGRETGGNGREAADVAGDIRAALARLREPTGPGDLETRRRLYRILRDAGEYHASHVTLKEYRAQLLDTEATLERISAHVQATVLSVSGEFRQSFRQAIAWSIGLMIAFFLSTVVGALTLSRVLGRQILLPIRGLLATTQAIAAGQLDERAQAGVDDEIGELAASFNHMTGKLRAAHEHLEQRVEERTRQLEQARRDVEVLNATLEQRIASALAEVDASHRTLLAAHDQLVQAETMASLGRMVAVIAHELNTPIGNSRLAASTLREHAESFAGKVANGLRRSDVDGLMRAIREGTRLLDGGLQRAAHLISSFKQVAVDQTSAQRRPLLLDTLIDEIGTTLEPSIRRSGCRLEWKVAPGIRLDSYPGALGHVLINLVENAMRHAFIGRPPGRIEVSASQRDDGEVQLSVSDDGVGIPEADQKKVFSPFFTTQMGRGGTGLGLSIVYNTVVEILGGRIALASEPGCGACFTISFPASAVPRGPGAAPPGGTPARENLSPAPCAS